MDESLPCAPSGSSSHAQHCLITDKTRQDVERLFIGIFFQGKPLWNSGYHPAAKGLDKKYYITEVPVNSARIQQGNAKPSRQREAQTDFKQNLTYNELTIWTIREKMT
jgi:hypothetical protein